MDDIDMKIISRLSGYCRESDREIGSKLGIAGGTVRQRIQKMASSGVVRGFALKIDPQTLGYDVFFAIVSGDAQKQAESMIEEGKAFMIVPCVGGISVYGILADNRAAQMEEMSRIDGVRVMLPRHAYGNISLTKTEMRIVEELIKDPTAKIKDIAVKTLLSTKTITRCIGRLRMHDGVDFTVMYDPSKISNFVVYTVIVTTSKNARTAMDRLKKEFADNFLHAPKWSASQSILFLYGKSIYAIDENVQAIRGMKDVLSADLFIPKMMQIPQEWISKAISEAQNSPRLHCFAR